MRHAIVLAAALSAIVAVKGSSAQDRALLAASTGRSLEDQLACLKPPRPALAIRAMLKNSIIAKTRFGADGVPVFRPITDLQVFGAKVLFVTGLEMEGDGVSWGMPRR